jgi:hypothetical protein
LAAVYVPPDKNSEFETISYAWKMSGAIGKNPEFHADEVARAFRDDVAWHSEMMSPGIRCLAG